MWKFFARMFNFKKHEEGEVIVSYGRHNITVPTRKKPKAIRLCVEELKHSIPVCCGNINLVGVAMIHRGFLICADIKTNSAVIKWFVEY